jgi:hypothetical protein
MPAAEFGVMHDRYWEGVVENMPIGGMAPLPVKGAATDLLQAMNSGEAPLEFPVFLDVSTSAQVAAALGARASTLPEAGGAAPGFTQPFSIAHNIKERVASNVANSVFQESAPQVVSMLESSLASSIRQETNRSVSRGLMQSLTATLTESLSHSLIGFLTETLSRSITREGTRSINSWLVPALSLELAIIVRRAITRSPQSDYFCHFCKTHSVYCESCQDTMIQVVSL